MNWVITDIWPIQVLCKVNQYGLATGQLSTLTDSRNLFVELRAKKKKMLLLSLSLSLWITLSIPVPSPFISMASFPFHAKGGL